ncbi:DUF5994 family protein [Nocardia sp. BMG51109]|uniref:DUF5994 family protein n=1 Tax=Nocardia sp. BMG51109 TaxID=1056816 RepID=UPI000466EDD0|nr:DUF5994 family protein [Nocardia sp. BMG51109]
MTSPSTAVAARHKTFADSPRLRVAPESRHTGHVDGAWWPRGNDLVGELPDLLAMLTARLGPIHRVIYHLDTWAPAPGKAAIGGRQVRLDGYRYRPADTIDVLALDGAALALLVIPPRTDPDSAHAAMTAAADLDNTSAAESLLALAAAHRDDVGVEISCAEQRWESEGGARAPMNPAARA